MHTRISPSHNTDGRRSTALGTLIVGIVLLLAASLRGDEQESASSFWTLDAVSNFSSSTLGGKQFWTDELVRGEWRVQRERP